MTYPCDVKEKSHQPVLSIRARTPVDALPGILGEGINTIYQYLSELGEQPAGAPFVAYYNMDMQDLDIEIGFPVAKELPGKEKVQSSHISGGLQATCLYTGPYPEIGLAYEELTQWVQDHGYQATGVAYEHYLSDPTTTPPEELKTQIVFPLKTP